MNLIFTRERVRRCFTFPTTIDEHYAFMCPEGVFLDNGLPAPRLLLSDYSLEVNTNPVSPIYIVALFDHFRERGFRVLPQSLGVVIRTSPGWVSVDVETTLLDDDEDMDIIFGDDSFRVPVKLDPSSSRSVFDAHYRSVYDALRVVSDEELRGLPGDVMVYDAPWGYVVVTELEDWGVSSIDAVVEDPSLAPSIYNIVSFDAPYPYLDERVLASLLRDHGLPVEPGQLHRL